MQFSKLGNNHLRHLATPDKHGNRRASPETIKSYEQAYGQFRGYLQAKNLSDDTRNFNPETCEGFIEYLREKGLHQNSIRQRLNALSSLAKYGCKQKDERGKYILAENPLLRIERPQRLPSRRRALRPRELVAWITVAVPENEAIARDVLLATLLRAHELAALDVSDVYEDELGRICISVSKFKGRDEEKGIALPTDVGVRLVAWLKQREAGKKEPLLVNRANRRYSRSSISNMFGSIGRKAGITRVPTRSHAVGRHTMNMIGRAMAKLDAHTRSSLLNHRDSRTIQEYDHSMPDETAEARTALWAALQSLVDGDNVPAPNPPGSHIPK